eukprot:gene9283-11379_t
MKEINTDVHLPQQDSSTPIYSITLVGNGSEPPFEAQGMILPSLGILRIIIPAGLEVSSLNPIIYSNYPSSGDENEIFNRDNYTVFHKGNMKPYLGNNDLNFEKKIERYGCFDYYVEWEDIENSVRKRGRLGTFQINPILKINNNPLPSDGIMLQTVLTKCLGPLEQWENHIKLASRLGYNMIHYTPVQEIGASGSSYSIYDQLSLSSKMFPNDSTGASAITQQEKLSRLSDFIKKAERNYNLLGMIDLVWNHTAHNTQWLSEHPEAGYNTDNSPHLKSAVILDDSLMQFSESINGTVIEDIEQLTTLIETIKETIIAPLKLWEFYVLDVDKEVEIFKLTYNSETRERDPSHSSSSAFSPTLLKNIISNPNLEKQETLNSILKKGIARGPSYERFSLHIDLNVTFKLLDSSASFRNLTSVEQVAKYEDLLRVVNLSLYRDYDSDLEAILLNVTERVKYERLAQHGPKLGPITKKNPLVSSYFTRVKYLDQATGNTREIPLANNGWIFNYNPSIDFASKDSRAYLRRDVIVWGDCVKLRYGATPSDNPWLWNHMKTYTCQMASIFHAIRVDNCHSTPIQVAQYFLDSAREVRPDIYVTCELFTGSEETDRVFVKKLGINSLIREAMVCHDSSELGRVCHRYGGKPICSITDVPYQSKFPSGGNISQVYNVTPLSPALPPALFMDCTHDNETPFVKRTIFDTLPNSAVVAMTVSAIGSTRGYDEMFSKTIDLVNETRLYESLGEAPLKKGIQPMRGLLNKLHLELSVNKYSEIHVHQDKNILLIQRYSPTLNKSIFLIAHSAYNILENEEPLSTVSIPCRISEFLFGSRIVGINSGFNWETDNQFLKGIDVDTEIIYGNQVIDKMIQIENDYSYHSNLNLKLKYFPPGSILVFRGEIPRECENAIENLNTIISNRLELEESLKECSLVDFNVLLFRNSEEEKTITGNGSYHIDHIGSLPFCGIQGFVTILLRICQWNDLGHPLCNNLRAGNWIMDYIVGRLDQRPGLANIKRWLSKCFDEIKKMPRHFIPKYFYSTLITAYRCIVDQCLTLMPKHIQDGNWFQHALAIASLQFYGVSTPLISNPKVLEGVKDREASLAAGLPHFSTGYMRSWGRDTFIALRGTMLVTGRLEEAKQLIIGFGSCLQFGLIPNLLDSGNKPRYNSRDSVWWYLKSIQDLYQFLPDEKSKQQLLSTKVYRLFPSNPSDPFSTLEEMIQEIMQAHATGIKFREPNAGTQIDDRMKDEGFNIDIKLNTTNGFIFGGNLFNCGTWMDKMGESKKANNFGDPATPRDGAPIEITAMVYSTVKWLSLLFSENKFKSSGVTLPGEPQTQLQYSQWTELIKTNFEKHYYIPSSNLDKSYIINTNYVRRRYIYKDTLGSKNFYSDFQFRPNMCIAMAFAPDLFVKGHVEKALDIIKSSLAGPLGMKTLDPNDPNYHGNYDNSNDSEYRPTAKGFNYHNGPEWVWVYGFFLESIINFKQYPNIYTKIHLIENLLQNHKNHILQSNYASLPELTNRAGAFCKDSCESQAWSVGTILASLFVLHNLDNPISKHHY